MTKSNGKYPNKEDLEPKVRGAANPGELPLADPADSNVTDVFRKNAQDKTGENQQSAFGANKVESDTGFTRPKLGEQFPYGDREAYNHTFNQHIHDKWNEEKPNESPFRP